MFVLQWLHGLRRLGHRVVLLNPTTGDDIPSADVEHFSALMTEWWSLDDAVLIAGDTDRTLAGLSTKQWHSYCRGADGLLTVAVSGGSVHPTVADIHPRILVDQDPGYTRLWAAQSSSFTAIFGEHDYYFTVGGNIGTARSRLPDFGVHWGHVWNPVILDWWPAGGVVNASFSTVADWWGMHYLEFEGEILGPKREEFLKFVELPKRCGERLNLVLDIPPHDPDLESLAQQGWIIHSPAVVESPAAYREWILGSAGEFSCAKGVYVGTRSGWFSDRTACYLAAGRPAIVQDTGLAELLPSGAGLLLVANVEEACEALRAVRRNPALHARAARALAERYLASEVVLPSFLRNCGIA
jgi:hypothetical protein